MIGFGQCVPPDGCENGEATYTWTDGENYVENWKDGEQNGQGTYTYANGNKYVGEFKNGMRHGKGTFSRPGKWIFEGTFTTNSSWSGILKDLTDGSKYKVRVIDGVMTEQWFLEKEPKGIEKKND